MTNSPNRRHEPTAACPCGRQQRARAVAFADCCAPLLDGRAAPDAEALMRSRYTAFVVGDADHLLKTWAKATRPTELTLDAATQWLGLEVRQHRVIDANHAEVEFVARSRSASTGGGRATRLHERSRFVREDGEWRYVDGDFL